MRIAAHHCQARVHRASAALFCRHAAQSHAPWTTNPCRVQNSGCDGQIFEVQRRKKTQATANCAMKRRRLPQETECPCAITRTCLTKCSLRRLLLGSRGLDTTVKSAYKLFTDHVQLMCKISTCAACDPSFTSYDVKVTSNLT